jgi:cytochrome-b5 reductase
MNRAEVAKLAIPVTVLTISASLLVYFWPRKKKEFLARGERKRAQIAEVKELSHDTKLFRVSLGHKDTILGLPVGKHITIYAPNPEKCLKSGNWNGKPDPDRGNNEIERKYTPTTGNETPGYVDLVIKVYRPGTTKMPDGKAITWADGGKLGLYLDGKKPGDFIEIMGPAGVNEYLGRGTFKLPGRTITVTKVGMMAGGTGITPMLQVVAAALRDPSDTCEFSLIYANKTQDDILCRDILDDLASMGKGRFKLYYTLDFPPANWQGKTGFITEQMIKDCLPAPCDNSLMLMCGPPPMVEYACKKNLASLGFDKKMMVCF